jgi:hypothetical protein
MWNVGCENVNEMVSMEWRSTYMLGSQWRLVDVVGKPANTCVHGDLKFDPINPILNACMRWAMSAEGGVLNAWRSQV